MNTPLCPECGRIMVLRTAKKGRYEGKRFYGCSGFPVCKKIIDINEIEEYIPIQESHVAASQDIFIDVSDQSRKDTYEKPQNVECRPNIRSFQVKVFENIASLPQIVKEINRDKHAFDREQLRAFSQWRLDFPYPKKEFSKDRLPVISVIEKILLRGSIIPCSPCIEKEINKTFGLLSDETGGFIELLNRVEEHPRSHFVAQQFDSEAEKFFYHETLLRNQKINLVCPWLLSQISASCLTLGAIDPNSKQRVDFLVCNPKAGKLVIEIDGPQHDSTKDADKKRDRLLTASGFNVERVKTTRQLEILQSSNPLSDLLKKLEDISVLDVEENPNLEILLLIKTTFQFQLALFEAIKGGWLELFDSCEWKVRVLPPKWVKNFDNWNSFIKTSLFELINVVEKIFFLHEEKETKIKAQLITSDSGEKPDIIVRFGWEEEEEHEIEPIFIISDIYLPITLVQPAPYSNPSYIKNPNKVIVKYFLWYIYRKRGFLEGQWEAIERTMQGKDSIVLLPTGGGKTIAFQLASFLLPGICLVIDPLIALINDQVDNLRDFGISRAIGITSQLTSEEKKIAIESFSKGNYIFCYVSPERLQIDEFRAALRSVTVTSPINVIAIDEAHCVSEWGHDFRVAYLNIARNARNYCTKDGITPPLLGLTGTASHSVLRDVRRELEINNVDSVITPRTLDRKNLHFEIHECGSKEKFDQLFGVFSSLPHVFNKSSQNFFMPSGDDSNTGLIFFPNVNGEFGIEKGFNVVRGKIGSHVGLYSGEAPKSVDKDMWNELKTAYAEKFKHNKLTLLTCTNAFGMGIDKPNIRYTIHMNIPRSIEAFYQEGGRAGRDGHDSQCILIISNDFPKRSEYLLDPNRKLKEVAQSLSNIPYCDNDDIARILYFHVNAFKGAEVEITEVENLLKTIGNIDDEKSVKIVFNNDEEKILKEKAVHRLVILGVIKDYTINYSSNEIEIIISGNSREENVESYLKYIGNYDKKKVNQARGRILQKDNEPHEKFILYLAESLIRDFIYEIIEASRRTSLSNMLQACISSKNDADFRTRVLKHLELGQYSEILDSARENTESLSDILDKLIDKLASPMESSELRGQTSRILEAYPDNPSLLLIRSLAEAHCTDKNKNSVFNNFVAFISFSVSPNGWGMDKRETIKIANKYINHIGELDEELAQDLVVASLEELSNDPDVARLIIKEVGENISIYATRILFAELNKNISLVL